MGVWTACIVDPQPAKGWFGRGSYWSQVRLGYRLKSFLSLQFWDQGNLWNQNKVGWERFYEPFIEIYPAVMIPYGEVDKLGASRGNGGKI